MTLARITNYVDGNVLTGAQLNNEFDNILNNGPALVGITPTKATQVMGLTGTLVANVGSFAVLAYGLRSTLGECSMSATSSFSVNTRTVGPIANGRDQAAAFSGTIEQSGVPAGSGVYLGSPVYTLPVVNSTPQVWYQVGIITGTSARLSVDLVGYTVPNGDVS